MKRSADHDGEGGGLPHVQSPLVTAATLDPGVQGFGRWAVDLFGPHRLLSSRENVFDPRISSEDRKSLVRTLFEHGGTDHLPPSISIGRAVDALMRDRAAAIHGHVCLQVWPQAPQPGGYVAVVAQNCYSGMRVQISAYQGAAGLVSALSKSSEIDRIKHSDCPDKPAFPEDPPVFRYAGLGIGSWLYVAAMTELDRVTGGDCRCVDNSSNEYVRAARWKLHCSDPFKWAHRRCRVCPAHRVDWASAQRSDFDGIRHDRRSDAPEFH